MHHRRSRVPLTGYPPTFDIPSISCFGVRLDYNCQGLLVGSIAQAKAPYGDNQALSRSIAACSRIATKPADLLDVSPEPDDSLSQGSEHPSPEVRAAGACVSAPSETQGTRFR